MQADEQVACLGAVAAAIAERDEGIRRPSHSHANRHGACSSSRRNRPDLERDVLLPSPTREEDTWISRVHTSMSRVDRDDVSRPETVGKPATVRSRGNRGREAGRHPSRNLVEASRAAVVPVAVTEVVAGGLLRRTGRAGTGCPRCTDACAASGSSRRAEDAEWRADQEAERLAGDGHLCPRLVHPDRAMKRQQQRSAQGARRHQSRRSGREFALPRQ